MKNIHFLTKSEMKKVLGGLEEPVARCKSDVLCWYDGTSGLTQGTCEAVGSNSQCRCVTHNQQGQATQSVPSTACLNTPPA